jgi:hypothetical protein
MSEPVEAPHSPLAQPIVIDLGKQSKKRIKRLKKSQGKLMDEVLDAVGQIHQGLGADAGDKTIVPVILIYRQKQRRSPFGF